LQGPHHIQPVGDGQRLRDPPRTGGQKSSGTIAPEKAVVYRTITVLRMLRTSVKDSAIAPRTKARQYVVSAVSATTATTSGTCHSAHGCPKNGGRASRAIDVVTVAEAGQKTLRPKNSNTGSIGEAAISGIRPCIRSQ